MNQAIHPLLSKASPTDTNPLSQQSKPVIQQHSSNSTNDKPNSANHSATDALLFQNLRGNAQELDLDSDSLGWAIIQSIHNQEHLTGIGTVSTLIQRLLNTTTEPYGALLLLPKSSQSTTQITPEIILNHILLFTKSNQRTEIYFSNLNGWKGLIEADRILFTSPGQPVDLQQQSNEIDPRFILSRVKPSTSLANELISPAQLRFPIYHLLSPPSKTITIPRLSNSTPSRGNTAQRLASLFSSRSESEPLTITVRVIDHKLDSVELDQSIARAVSNRIKDGLGSLEESMLNIIQKFISRLSVSKQPSDLFSSTEALPLHLATNQEIGEVIQEMYHEIDDELEKEYREEIEAVETEDETRMIIDHTLELIEEVICVELYDRIFEESHQDQELSEKIAQLNLLDMTLDHLGLDLERREMDDPDGITAIRTGLDEIIKAASIELSRLQDSECRSPRDKVGVYVTVHKLIVDGLSSLPPIPMKREGIPTGVATAAQDGVNSNEVEMSQTLDRTGILADTATMDRTLPMSTTLRPLPKDQASASDLMDAMHTSLIDLPEPPSANPDDVQLRVPDSSQPTIPRPNSSSADLILPILIYLIIKANPNNLISNLNYANRFRYQRLVKGETDYCLVNFSVSCEFIKNFVGLDGFEALPTTPTRATRQETPKGSIQGSYGTFTSSGKRTREKTGNSEVEDALIAASRAVSGVLMGGYQKVISSSLLDAPAARLGLAGGTRTGPRTLEDVKKLIGSGSGGKREGNMSVWSNRVGLLRRNPTTNDRQPDSSQTNALSIDTTGNGSNTVKRLSSLFHNTSPVASSGHTPIYPSQADEDRVSISQRLSHLPGFGRLGHQASQSKESINFKGTQIDESNAGGISDNISIFTADRALNHHHHHQKEEGGPIERLERCENSDHLLISDVPILLADYQRLCKIGRDAGLW
ncbi:hypothetical protein Pst134EA_025391 [Puccinia striiformis f. sp. tritici]|uniref:hypothetical protein n=1 Tax=Puccinia striiformis f. sp. tritici TaxID=168172 RepID=UPI002007A6FE|nr:hypothetical protein Pst134EA_025391 [Puccinia striiformis f. sp. tritici]KAH9451437.1 hypothetical protein Pst134EA_025391 [Puccinia striiformis f. sp. tritici]